MNDLAGKTAIVTGASSGIGRATALDLARRGARVALVGRRRDALESVAEAAGAQAFPLVADVRTEREARTAVRDAIGALGKVDFLVHAAGVVTPTRIEDLTGEVWREHIDINLNGAFYVMHECATSMSAAKSGSITAIASDLSFKGMPAYAHYCASKAGLAGMVKAFALELSPHVRVNAICPGPVDTPMMTAELEWFGGGEHTKASFLNQVPLKRFASPEEIARFVSFVTVDAPFTTGSLLSIDGGTTAG